MGEGSDKGTRFSTFRGRLESRQGVRHQAAWPPSRYASCGRSAVYFCASLIVRVMARTESGFSSQRFPSRVQALNDLTPASWVACRSSAQASSRSASWAGVSRGLSVSTGDATGTASAVVGVRRRPRKSRSRKAISPLSKSGGLSRQAQGFRQARYPPGLFPLILLAPEDPATPNERRDPGRAERPAAPNGNHALSAFPYRPGTACPLRPPAGPWLSRIHWMRTGCRRAGGRQRLMATGQRPLPAASPRTVCTSWGRGCEGQR